MGGVVGKFKKTIKEKKLKKEKKKKKKKKKKNFFFFLNLATTTKYASISRNFSGAVAASVGSVQF